MAFDSTAYNIIILQELGQRTNAELRALLSVYWDLHADKGTDARRYLYVKRSAIDFLLSTVWQDVDVREEDEQARLSQKSTHLQKMRDNIDMELKRLDGGISTSTPASTLSDPFIGAIGTEFG